MFCRYVPWGVGLVNKIGKTVAGHFGRLRIFKGKKEIVYLSNINKITK